MIDLTSNYSLIARKYAATKNVLRMRPTKMQWKLYLIISGYSVLILYTLDVELKLLKWNSIKWSIIISRIFVTGNQTLKMIDIWIR